MTNFCPWCGKPFNPDGIHSYCDPCRKEGIPMKNAGAILASSSRNASPAAKKVKGK